MRLHCEIGIRISIIIDRLLDAVLALPVSRNKPQSRKYPVQDQFRTEL